MDMNEYIAKYRSDRREYAYAKLGGACAVCKSYQDLQFDHINPATKVNTIANLWTASLQKFNDELDKCQLLCVNCHRVKTGNDGSNAKPKGPIPAHGTLSRYDRHNCRCVECKRAKSIYRKSRSHPPLPTTLEISMYKLILINPHNKTITDKEVENFDFEGLYKVLDCDIIEQVRVDYKTALLCDEEGLFKPTDKQAFFRIGQHPHRITGKAVIVGFSPNDGEYHSYPYDLLYAAGMVTWV